MSPMLTKVCRWPTLGLATIPATSTILAMSSYFITRFWVCLVLSVPVLLYSPMLQMWFRFTMPQFPGSEWVSPLFALIVFGYGGMPFLQMAIPELCARQPGMMTLISLAITVALVYSIAALWIDPVGGFFWELVTLIGIMLLGHWPFTLE